MEVKLKYIEINTGIPYLEYPPKIFMDFWISKPCLRRNYKDSYQQHSIFGAFGFYFAVILKWRHVERAKNENELDLEKRVNKFIKDFNGSWDD